MTVLTLTSAIVEGNRQAVFLHYAIWPRDTNAYCEARIGLARRPCGVMVSYPWAEFTSKNLGKVLCTQHFTL